MNNWIMEKLILQSTLCKTYNYIAALGVCGAYNQE
jgi:hypothetical protein